MPQEQQLVQAHAELLEKAAWMRALLQSLREVPSNMPYMLVTLDTTHELSGWLNEQYANIFLIFVTLDTFHLLSGWLKDPS